MALEEAEVDELRELHALRQRSRTQHHAGLQLLAQNLTRVASVSTSTATHSTREPPGLIPRATFFKTLARASQRGELAKEDTQAFEDLVRQLTNKDGEEDLRAYARIFGLNSHLPAPETSTPADPEQQLRDFLESTDGDRNVTVTPGTGKAPEKPLTLYHHAKLLQALASHPATIFGQWMFAAYYRVILGLYCAGVGARPGEAREGRNDQPSAFLTNECVTGLLALRKGLSRVSRLLSACERLARAADHSKCVPADTALRHATDAATHALRVSCTMATQQTWAVPMSNRRDEPFELDALLKAIRKQTEKARTSLETLDSLLENKSTSSCGSNTYSQKELQEHFARITGRIAIVDSKNKVERLHRAMSSSVEENATIHQVTRALQVSRDIIADIISDLDGRLRPCAVFAGNVLDEHICRAELNPKHPRDTAELISAAAILGYTVGWDDERIQRSFTELSEQVSLEGIFNSFRPLSVDGVKGNTRTIISAQTLRTFSMVGKHAKNASLRVPALKKMLQLAEHTHVNPRNGMSEGWRHEMLGNHAPQEWWVTGHMVSALGAFARMLDHLINRRVFRHFHVRQPAELKVGLDDLLYPDWQLAALRAATSHEPTSVASLLLSMQLHLSGFKMKFTENSPKCLGRIMGTWSAVLYGPPGTGKTTLIEAVAKSSGRPLVEVTPSDLMLGGERDIEARARNVFLLLSMLTDTVILLDEFDQLLQRRDKAAKTPDKIYEFLTPGMLPKLKQLHSAAKSQRVVYALSTNRIDSLDEAAIREGRFDKKLGVYPTDWLSRRVHLHLLLPTEDEAKLIDGVGPN